MKTRAPAAQTGETVRGRRARGLLAFTAGALSAGLLVTTTADATVEPSSYSGTIEQGGSDSLTKTVDIPEVTPKLDLVLDVDLSGSYNDDIATIKSKRSDLFNGVRASVPDSAFGLVSFVDYPFQPWGSDWAGDYAYGLDQDLTADQVTWETAVVAMVVRNGADAPESQLESLYQAATGAGRDVDGNGLYTDLGDIAPGLAASFRPDATRVVAITTDAPMHVAGDAGWDMPSYPGPSMADTIAALNAADIHVVAIKAPGATSQMDDLAAATGGAVVTTDASSSEIVEAIVSAIEELTFDVTAAPQGCAPLEVTFDPASHEDVSGGTQVQFEETIAVPSDTAPGHYSCTVDFLAGDTVIGTQTIDVDVPDPNSPPDCSNASPSTAVLWPPDHTLRSITVEGVTDAESTTSIVITGIRQDEATNGLGDGDTGPDGFGVGTSTAEVRAERAGFGNGRVYQIGFTATDEAGATCSGTVAVSVPRSMRPHIPAVDDGPAYDSTV